MAGLLTIYQEDKQLNKNQKHHYQYPDVLSGHIKH